MPLRGDFRCRECPTLTVTANLNELEEYEMHVYDVDRLQTLVAAIEIVSPANKDRSKTRQPLVNTMARPVATGRVRGDH